VPVEFWQIVLADAVKRNPGAATSGEVVTKQRLRGFETSRPSTSKIP